MKKTINLVKNSKVYKVWARSWGSFVLAFAALAAVWGLCFLAVARFAPGALKFFYWGGLIAVIIGLILLIFNEPIVVLTMGAKRVRDRSQAPKLYDAVHSVMPVLYRPVPRIYLVDTRGMNAFAFGWGVPLFSAVGATRGIVESLDREELEAVMAHEIGHILNLDMLVSMVMTISVLIMALTGWLLLRVAPYFSDRRGSSGKKQGGAGLTAFCLIIGGGMFLFGRMFAYILQMFVLRQREYAADARSSKTMGTSRYLASALKKIVRNPRVGSAAVGAAVGFLCTADPDPSDMFSTHPSMEKRLAALAALETG